MGQSEQKSSGSQSATRALAWRAAAFLVAFSVLQLGWQALRGSGFEHFVIHTCTVVPATWVANHLTPGLGARATGFSILAPGGGLNVQNGCEGLEALFVLMAAFLIAPAPWRARPLGLVGGALVVFVANQVRILVLFYAFRDERALFDPLHTLVTPLVIILAVASYFYVWLSHHSRLAGAA
jgi:exosortase/archaeosortase family protein